MQEILYDESPYIVLVYAKTLEAYDTARWRGLVQVAGRDWFGPQQLVAPGARAPVTRRPAAAAGCLPVAIIAAVAAAGLVILLIWRHRGKRGGGEA